MNSKGKDQAEQDFFAKFILNSNNETNFVPTDSDEIRFWVRKIRGIKKKNTELLRDLTEEIPAFLYYLKTREMATPKLERHWFYTSLLHTDALRKLQMNSRSTPEKEIRAYMKGMFEVTELSEITMCLTKIREVIFKQKFERNYLEQILEGRMGMVKSEGTGGKYYKFPVIVEREGDIPEIKMPSFTGRYYTFKREDFLKEDVKLNDNSPQAVDDTPF